jgi:hypothetical protein
VTAGCSWLDMVEIFFGIITRQAIRRGTFRSVQELTAAIGRFIDTCNDSCEPSAHPKSARLAARSPGVQNRPACSRIQM